MQIMTLGCNTRIFMKGEFLLPKPEENPPQISARSAQPGFLRDRTSGSLGKAPSPPRTMVEMAPRMCTQGDKASRPGERTAAKKPPKRQKCRGTNSAWNREEKARGAQNPGLAATLLPNAVSWQQGISPLTGLSAPWSREGTFGLVCLASWLLFFPSWGQAACDVQTPGSRLNHGEEAVTR